VQCQQQLAGTDVELSVCGWGVKLVQNLGFKNAGRTDSVVSMRMRDKIEPKQSGFLFV